MEFPALESSLSTGKQGEESVGFTGPFLSIVLHPSER